MVAGWADGDEAAAEADPEALEALEVLDALPP